MNDEKRPVRVRRSFENMIYKESSFFFMVVCIAGLLIAGTFYIYRIYTTPHETYELVIGIFAFVCCVFLSMLTVAILRQWSEVIGRFRMSAQSSRTRVGNINLESYSVVEEKHTKALEQSIQAIGSDIIEGIIRGNREAQLSVTRAFSDLFNETVLPVVNRSNEQAARNGEMIERMQKQMESRISKVNERVSVLSDDFARITEMEKNVFSPQPAEEELPKPLTYTELVEKLRNQAGQETVTDAAQPASVPAEDVPETEAPYDGMDEDRYPEEVPPESPEDDLSRVDDQYGEDGPDDGYGYDPDDGADADDEEESEVRDGESYMSPEYNDL